MFEIIPFVRVDVKSTVPEFKELTTKLIWLPIKVLSMESPERLAAIPLLELSTIIAEPVPLSTIPLAIRLIVAAPLSFDK